MFVVASAFAVANILIALGRLGDAIQAYRQALHLAAGQGKEAQQITAHHHLGLAMLYREVGRDDLPPITCSRPSNWANKPPWWTGHTVGNWPRPTSGLLEGDLEAALALLDEARQSTSRTQSRTCARSKR